MDTFPPLNSIEILTKLNYITKITGFHYEMEGKQANPANKLLLDFSGIIELFY